MRKKRSTAKKAARRGNKMTALAARGKNDINMQMDKLMKTLSIVGSPLNKTQLRAIMAPTPPAFIKERPAKGGGKWKYVPGQYVKQRLNIIFGFNWTSEVLKVEEKYKQVVALVKLTVFSADGKRSISKTQAGGVDIKFLKRDPGRALDYANDMKAAITEGLKKCASEFGVCNDVYWQNEKFEQDYENRQPKNVTSPPYNPGKAPANIRTDLPIHGDIRMKMDEIKKRYPKRYNFKAMIKVYKVGKIRDLTQAQSEKILSSLVDIIDSGGAA